MVSLTSNEEIKQTSQREVSEKHGSVVMKDFADISAAEEKELSEILAKHKGIAQLGVHTHFDEHTSTSAYIANRRQHMQKIFESDQPLLLLIPTGPKGSYERLIDIYKQYYDEYVPEGQVKQIYFVRTLAGAPTPCLLEGTNDSITSQHADKNWDCLAEKCKAIGVKQFLVSGRNFSNYDKPFDALDQNGMEYAKLYSHFEQDADNIKVAFNMPSGCVGGAIINFSVRGIRSFGTGALM